MATWEKIATRFKGNQDAIYGYDLFLEFGWDYTYHAFRENPIWSLEHEGEENASLKVKKDGDTDRMKVMKAKWALNKARGSR